MLLSIAIGHVPMDLINDAYSHCNRYPKRPVTVVLMRECEYSLK